MNRRALSLVVLVAAAAALGYFVHHIPTRGDNGDSARKVVATIAGKPVYEDEILSRAERELHRIRSEEYEILNRALDDLINERLLEAEAKKRGLPAEDLLKTEVDAKVPLPTDPEVAAFYESRRAQIGRAFEAIKEPLRRAMHQAQREEAREAWFATLRTSAEVAVLLRPPKVKVEADPARLRGPSDAPVVIVEFSDYQCPFCRRAQPTVQEVLAKYGDRVSHSFRDFPIDELHPQARKAAEAARCAGEQGKFWEYHKLLFDNFGRLGRDSLAAHAASLQLNHGAFSACLDSGKFAAAVEADYQEGQRLGVDSTPQFFVNGVRVTGSQPFSVFERIINAELADMKK